MEDWLESGNIRNKEVKCFNYYCPEMKWVVDIYCHDEEAYVAGWCGLTKHQAMKFYKEKVTELETNTVQSSIDNWLIPLRN